MVDEDLVMDGWTDIARRVRSRIMALPAEQFTPEGMLAAYEESDFEKMEEIRARVDAIVEDPATAQGLKAWYGQLCKRPCFHDEYLQAYNHPGTHLVDTDGKGVERITETARGRGRRDLRGRLHHLRLGLRGRDRVHPPGRVRRDGPGRGPAVRAVGRRHAHAARHPRPRVPERLPGAAHPGRQPDLERAPQPGRVGAHDRGRRRPRAGRGPGRGRGGRRGPGRLGGPAAVGAAPLADRVTRLHSRLLQQRGPGRRTRAGSSSSGIRPAPRRTSSSSTPGAARATSTASSSAAGARAPAAVPTRGRRPTRRRDHDRRRHDDRRPSSPFAAGHQLPQAVGDGHGSRRTRRRARCRARPGSTR